jgi:hypothetical protein
MSASTGYSGYYQYPGSTTVSASLQFGGLSYSISNADFNLGSFTRDTSMCTGAFPDRPVCDLLLLHARRGSERNELNSNAAVVAPRSSASPMSPSETDEPEWR